MTTVVMKDRLKAAIDRLEDDDDLLMELAELLDVDEYELSEEELEMVAIARQEIESGKVIPHEQVIEDAQRWILESYGQYKQIGNFGTA